MSCLWRWLCRSRSKTTIPTTMNVVPPSSYSLVSSNLYVALEFAGKGRPFARAPYPNFRSSMPLNSRNPLSVQATPSYANPLRGCCESQNAYPLPAAFTICSYGWEASPGLGSSKETHCPVEFICPEHASCFWAEGRVTRYPSNFSQNWGWRSNNWGIIVLLLTRSCILPRWDEK